VSLVDVGQVWRYKTGDFPSLPWLSVVLVLGKTPSWEGEEHWLVLNLDTGVEEVSVSLLDPTRSHIHWERVA
jgi:hypothetical protein